jgi:hypothetical protein
MLGPSSSLLQLPSCRPTARKAKVELIHVWQTHGSSGECLRLKRGGSKEWRQEFPLEIFNLLSSRSSSLKGTLKQWR